jgi:NADPH:quinone reductase-like Zn-dependent oxidoreductase
MKAVICKEYGSPNVLNLIEVDKPSPGPNQILIQQKATTVNSGDVRIRKADPFLVRLAFGITRPKFPILGMVVSGIVEKVGCSVTNFAPGDEVFGINEKTFGCYAEYIVVNDTIALTKKPKGTSFEDAAAIVFGGHTALHFLRKADVQKGQTILIYGASGSVGTAIIQIAKHFGAVVTAVSSKENIPLVKSLGADQAIDYVRQLIDLVCPDTYGVSNLYESTYAVLHATSAQRAGAFLKTIGKWVD